MFRQRTGDNDIWVIELARNLARRVTDGPPADAHPLWDPDGQHVVFISQRFGRRSDAAGGDRRKGGAALRERARTAWSCRGRAIASTSCCAARAQTGADLVAVTTRGEPREVVVAQSPYDETEGQFSPDGQLGRLRLQRQRPSGSVRAVVPRRAARGRRCRRPAASQVRWSGDGREIFYVAPDGRMMAVVDRAAPVRRRT